MTETVRNLTPVDTRQRWRVFSFSNPSATGALPVGDFALLAFRTFPHNHPSLRDFNAMNSAECVLLHSSGDTLDC